VVSAGNQPDPSTLLATCNRCGWNCGLRNTGRRSASAASVRGAVSAPRQLRQFDRSVSLLHRHDVNNGATTPGTNGYTDQINPNLGTSFSAPMVRHRSAHDWRQQHLRASQLIARLKEGAKAFPVSSDPTSQLSLPASANDLEPSSRADVAGAGMGTAPPP